MDKVTIAGCGVAGGFLALRALQLGFEPTLLRVTRPAVGGVEIIPASAGRLLEELVLGDVLAGLEVGFGDNLSRHWPDGTVDLAPGRSLHVDRLKLRAAVLAEAVRRGARIRDVERLPPVDPASFSVDATGQRAVWSRPVVREGPVAADVFVAEAAALPGSGRLAFLDRGWAYLASDQKLATVGVVARYSRAPAILDPETCRALGLSLDAPFRFVGRRPAYLQWAVAPVAGRRLTIGDAACHHNPIGGRGIAFALGSAFAAATVLATWRDDAAAEAATQSYYEGYVAAEVRRHRRFLEGEMNAPATPSDLPEHIRWTASGSLGVLAVNMRVVAGEFFSLASGAEVRWAGGLDLARLRDFAVKSAPSARVVERLQAEGMTVGEARGVLGWALAGGLLSPSGQRDG